MSRCRINTNMMSGSGIQKATDPAKAKEVNDKLVALLAARAAQDKDATMEPLTEKEYETKYGKQAFASSASASDSQAQ